MKIALLILAMSICMGCGIPPQPNDNKNTSNNLTYFKDKHGICYASICTYNGHFGCVTSIATVSCEKVGL